MQNGYFNDTIDYGNYALRGGKKSMIIDG